MKYLVAGGTGFLGEVLAQTLRQAGFSVKNFDKNLCQTENLYDTQFVGNIKNFNDCLEATKGMNVVFHNIAAVPLNRSKKEFFEINIVGTKNLLEASKVNGVRTFVFTSSSAVFGKPYKNPVGSNSPLNPFEPYGISKLQGEKLCEAYREKGLIVHIVRPRTIVGPKRLGIFSVIFQLLQSNAAIPIFNYGKRNYDFIHVNDLAKALVKCALMDESLTLNLGSYQKSNLIHILESLKKQSGSDSIFFNLPKKPFKSLILFLSKIRLLPFAPYQILLYGEEFYFESSKDWKRIGLSPQYTSINAVNDAFLSYRDRNTLEKQSSIHKTEISLKSTFIKFLVIMLRSLNNASIKFKK